MELEHNEPFGEEAPSRWEGLQTRVISGAVLLAVALGIVWHGGFVFHLFVLLAAMMMVKEWNQLTASDGPAWHLAGMFYAAIPCASLIWLRELNFESDIHGGAHVVLYVLLAVWATDIGAYAAGRQFGVAKLAPSISPGKTWVGLGGGVLLAGIAGGLAHSFSPFPAGFGMSIVLAMLIALIAQGGDLFESWLKRRAGVKDSGKLIPGHGGLLDRIDGLVFALPLYAWAVSLAGAGQ